MSLEFIDDLQQKCPGEKKRRETRVGKSGGSKYLYFKIEREER